MAFPKPRLRTESTSNRPSNRLAELSRLAGCLRLHSTSKCAKWLMLRAEKRFLSRAPLRPDGGRIEGTRARHIPVLDLPGSRWRLSDSRTKTAPLLIRCAVSRNKKPLSPMAPLVPFSQLERENNYMISVMQSTMLDFAVVTPFCTCFSSEISWGTVALFTSCSMPLVLPRLGLLSGRKSTAKIAHAM